MDEEFIYHDQFPEYVDKMKELVDSLASAKDRLEKLRGKMNSGSWTVEAKDNASAYLLIIIEYMNRLCANNLTPCQKMTDALVNFRNQMESFEGSSEAVRHLRSIEP